MDDVTDKGTVPPADPNNEEGATIPSEETPEDKEKRYKTLIGKLQERTAQSEELQEKLRETEAKLKEIEEEKMMNSFDDLTEDQPVSKKELEMYTEKIFEKKRKEADIQKEFQQFKADNEIGSNGWEKINGQKLESTAKSMVASGVSTSYYEAIKILYDIKAGNNDGIDRSADIRLKTIGTGGGSSAKQSSTGLSSITKEVASQNGWEEERAKAADEIVKKYF